MNIDDYRKAYQKPCKKERKASFPTAISYFLVPIIFSFIVDIIFKCTNGSNSCSISNSERDTQKVVREIHFSWETQL